jgi:hypothetical protein
MNRWLRWIALGLALASLLWWLGAGANSGWTKTSVPIKTVDEVTGIEAVAYESRFIPGLDLLGVLLLGAGVLAGASFLFRTKKQQLCT